MIVKRSYNKKNKKTYMEMDFSKCGIYRITGNNGSGKTIFLEDIVYGQADIEFHDSKLKSIYAKDRHSLISYVPQNIETDEVSIYDYVIMGNTQIDRQEVRDKVKALGMEYADLNKKITLLSGGEMTKLAIIAAILKNTPYIFMDEPTNNLDDESVEAIKAMLEEIRKDRTVVIVTHDPRMDGFHDVAIDIDSEMVNKTTDLDVDNTYNISMSKISHLAMAYKNMIRPGMILGILFVLVVMIALVINIHNKLTQGYVTDDSDPKGIIATYIVDWRYNDLNRRYAEYTGIDVSKEDYENLIKYEDVENISNIEGVNNIVFSDDKYLENIPEISKQIDEKKPAIISMPQIIMQEYNDVYEYGIDYELMRGRIPYDNENEVALSGKMLRTFFGWDGNAYEDVMGTQINIEGVDYTVVGIISKDVCYISYNKNRRNGFCIYDDESDKLFEEIIEYKEKTGYVGASYPQCMLIYTDKEKDTLDYLIKNYPGQNYVSYCFDEIWTEAYNRDFMISQYKYYSVVGIWLTAIFVCFFNSVGLAILKKNRMWGCYYVNKRELNKMMIAILSVITAITWVITMAVARTFSAFYLKIAVIVSVIMLIMYLSLAISIAWGNRRYVD